MRQDASGEPSERRRPASLAPVVVPIALSGWAVAALAVLTLPAGTAGIGAFAGAAALLAAAVVAEAFPVPVEGVSAGGISLAAAFLVGTALVYDWQTAALVALLARATIELAQRRPFLRLAFNSSVYALSGAAAGVAVAAVGDATTPAAFLMAAGAGSLAFYAVNVPLVALAVARNDALRFGDVLVRSVRGTALPFAIMASVALILHVLWERSPALAGVLAGPIFALGLYQRSAQGQLEALHLAKTDPLTGLGNHRAFQEQLVEDLEQAKAGRTPLTLCLVDIDEFKQINDRFGHQVGDVVLQKVAARLDQPGPGFRLGGDELAIVLRGRGARESLAFVQGLVARIGREAYGIDAPVTVSAGVAAFPEHGEEADQLFGAADAALYQSKHAGKNQVQVFDRRRVALDSARSQKLALRLRAARRLAEIVDAADGMRNDASDGHSRRVAELAREIAIHIGLHPEQVELIRLAGRLHDLGKLAIPVEVLAKSGELVDRDWRLLREHPETGRSILQAIGAAPIADWVLYHHERWDGAGYPSRLAAEEIPLGSRIIFVADAYDAITSARPYRGARSRDEALAELERCAGTQFDPGVVAALIAVLEESDAPAELADVG